MPDHCYDILSGYKAARKNPLTNDYNVTYDAELQQVKVSDGHKYITVCEGHNNLISSRTLAQAKLDRFDSTQWCDDCRKLISCNCYGCAHGYECKENSLSIHKKSEVIRKLNLKGLSITNIRADCNYVYNPVTHTGRAYTDDELLELES